MNLKLIYVSPNGTTRITSQALKEEFEKDGHQVKLIDIGRRPYRGNFQLVINELKEADIVGFGSPAYHMDMLEPLKKLLKEMLTSDICYSFKAFLYLNYAGITSGKALLNTAKFLEKMSIPIIGSMKVTAPHFHHNGNFSAEGIREFAHNFYSDMKAKDFTAISQNQVKAVFSPQKIRVNFLYPFVRVIGKRRELPISILQEKCKGCGKCEKECPVGAISIDGCASIDFTKCIHCYHCTAACKLNAVTTPIEKLDKMIRRNRRIIGTENPQNQIHI